MWPLSQAIIALPLSFVFRQDQQNSQLRVQDSYVNFSMIRGRRRPLELWFRGSLSSIHNPSNRSQLHQLRCSRDAPSGPRGGGAASASKSVYEGASLLRQLLSSSPLGTPRFHETLT